jgi:hypothetical protein
MSDRQEALKARLAQETDPAPKTELLRHLAVVVDHAMRKGWLGPDCVIGSLESIEAEGFCTRCLRHVPFVHTCKKAKR